MNYDRIILELMDRVAALEEEVAALKSQKTASDIPTTAPVTDAPIYNGRDKTKYMLNGIRYGKNRLALAIVSEYCKTFPNVTAATLMATFDRSLQGSLGVIRTLSDVQNSYGDYQKRFFCQSNEIIHTQTEDCVVCTQWGVGNIGNIIARANELGINITTI